MDYRSLLIQITMAAAAIWSAAAGASISQPVEAVSLPGSSWEVQQGEQECHLVRQFQAAGGPLLVDIVRGGGPEQVDLLLVGEGVPKVRPDYYFWIGVTAQGDLRYFSGASGTLPKQPGRMLFVRDMPSRIFGNLASPRTLTLSTKKAPILMVDLPESNDGFLALQSCYENLLRLWHVDPSQLAVPINSPREGSLSEYGNPGSITAQRTDLPKIPIDPNSWIWYNDYPTEALRREVGGTVVAALTVDPSGKPTRCDVVVSSDFSDLDKTTCERMLARARYRPSTEQDAGARLRRAVERVRWIIPVQLR